MPIPLWNPASPRTASPSFSCRMVSSVDQAVLHGIVSEVGVRFHPHLLQNPRTVGAYGLYREMELVGDLRDRLATRELAEDLEFTLRQRPVQRLVAVARDALGEHLRERRAHVLASLHRGADRTDELRGRSLLVDVAGGTCAKQVHGVLL